MIAIATFQHYSIIGNILIIGRIDFIIFDFLSIDRKYVSYECILWVNFRWLIISLNSQHNGIYISFNKFNRI